MGLTADRTRTLTDRVFCFSLVVWLGLAGCGRSSPARIEAPPLDPAEITTRVMKELDANGDGTLTRDELLKSPATAAALKSLIPGQGDGISQEAVRAWLDRVRASRVAFQSLILTVTHRNRPLASATVRLVPLACMGSSIQPAEGVSDDNGTVICSVPGNSFPGVHCGLYRVEITGSGNDGKPLATRHNIETVHGLAVGDEVPAGGRAAVTLSP